MRNRSLTLVFICFFLAGCPAASWHIKPDVAPRFSVTDSCVRSATKFGGVLGIVKLDWNRTDSDFERYLIETDYGIAGLDLQFDSNGIPTVGLYLHGGGDTPPRKAKEGGKDYLNKLLKYLQKSCADHS